MSIVCRTRSAQATHDLAAAVAGLLGAGDVVVLTGDLGAGKTAFAKGLGAGLGVDEPVTSPTFTLADRHRGRDLWFHHLDVYRLDEPAEVGDLDLPELLEEGGVVAIEWGDRIASSLPADRLEVHLEWEGVDDERRIELEAKGAWVARRLLLAAATEAWRSGS